MIVEVDYLDLSEWDREILLNGCGAEGGFHLNLIFKEICNLHDFRYRCGGSEEDRESYDLEFRDGLHAAVDALSWWRFISRWTLRRAAKFYYYLVVQYGQSTFTYREEKHGETMVTLRLLHYEQQENERGGIRKMSPLMHCFACAA